MKHIVRTGILCGCAVLSVTPMARPADRNPASAEVAAGDIVPGIWQHHEVTINYFGITSLYSCDGLEDQVRSILLHFGARKDAKVTAVGCPGGPEVPTRSAWVKADFYTLQPAIEASAGTAPAANTVRAYWAPRELTPRRPNFMGDGDCELVDQMRDLISKSFALRDVVYRTECVPNEIVLDGFSIKGQALLPASAGPPPATVG